ncbi:MAG: dihydrofolate reductase family protein [Acidimicrobiia bacterium]
MGQLTVIEFTTLDGVAQGPGAPDEDPEGGFPHGGWQAPFDDEAAAAVMFERAQRMDALLLGRKTFDLFAGYWPQAPAEAPFTRLLNETPKYVATHTLHAPPAWSGATVLEGPLREGVEALRSRYDEVHVIGSLDLVQSLLREGLVDRLELWVYPLVLGTGKRVFAEGAPPLSLRLTETVEHRGGVLHLSFETAGVPTYGTMGP